MSARFNYKTDHITMEIARSVNEWLISHAKMHKMPRAQLIRDIIYSYMVAQGARIDDPLDATTNPIAPDASTDANIRRRVNGRITWY